MGGPTSTITDKMAIGTLNELFDTCAAYVGTEGMNQRKLVTQKSLQDSLKREAVYTKLHQVVPALKDIDYRESAEKIMAACPNRLDKAGLGRQELTEAILALRGELSMNHFVSISMKLRQLE